MPSHPKSKAEQRYEDNPTEVKIIEGIVSNGLYCVKCNTTYTCSIYNLAKEAYWKHQFDQHKGDVTHGISIICAGMESTWSFGSEEIFVTLLFTPKHLKHLKSQLQGIVDT